MRDWLRGTVAELEFDRSRLSPKAQTPYYLWRHGLERTALPLSILERRIDEWVAAERR